MNYTDEELNNYQKSAFDFTLYQIRNIEASEEISMQVISLFLLQYDKIENPQGWIINTSKNYCKKYFYKNKKEQKLTNSIHQELSNHIEKFEDENSELNEAFKESYQELNETELSTLVYYFNCDKSIKQMHLNTGEAYSTLRKRISRIKNKLKAETFRRLGYYGSKKVVTPQLNDLIKAFLKRFKQHVENDSLNKMFYYFSKIDINKYNFEFDINKILDYEISLNKSIYKTWVGFKDSNNIPKSFKMSFLIDEKNYLKIVSPPKLIEQMKILHIKSTKGQELINILNIVPDDLSGHPNLTKEKMDKLLKEYNNR
ncbi:MAG: sigma-70 family RNA polymerase sigma factor [Candidatus Cloacimonetes bacterium]|nr:sigma-70 family RNA polymerase sigma factor [Candidatus Cloacimonadota bacterium]